MGKKSKKDRYYSDDDSDASQERKNKKKHKRERKGSKRRSSKHKDRSNEKNGRQKQERYRFDSPPKEHELTQGIMAAAASLGAGSGAVTGNTHTLLQNIFNISMAQSAKIDRKLYVGNLPPGITQRMLIDLVNEAMLSLGVIEEPGNPVVSAWISSDGHYAFVEFRTADEANHGFKLQGMNIQGTEIKIGRPKAYNGAASAMSMMQNGAAITPSVLLGKTSAYHPLDDNTTQGIQNPLMGGKMAQFLNKIQPPTRVLRIRNIATLKMTKDDNVFSDLFSDVMDLCLQYGKVLDIKIPRPAFRVQKEDPEENQENQENREEEEEAKKPEKKKQEKKINPMDDPKNYDFPEGFGNAYVEFTSVYEARRARRNIQLMKYNDQLVECDFHDEQMFEKNDFSSPQVIQIEQRDEDFEGLENVAIEFTQPRESEPMRL